jgi:hypothetical protein
MTNLSASGSLSSLALSAGGGFMASIVDGWWNAPLVYGGDLVSPFFSGGLSTAANLAVLPPVHSDDPRATPDVSRGRKAALAGVLTSRSLQRCRVRIPSSGTYASYIYEPLLDAGLIGSGQAYVWADIPFYIAYQGNGFSFGATVYATHIGANPPTASAFVFGSRAIIEAPSLGPLSGGTQYYVAVAWGFAFPADEGDWLDFSVSNVFFHTRLSLTLT